MYQCIGQRKEGSTKIRCSNTSNVPSRVDHPDWGWLCPSCLHGRLSVTGKLVETNENWREEMAEKTDTQNQVFYQS